MDLSAPIEDAQPPRPLGQRRYIVLLFADIVDSMGHAERLEPEEFAELLAQFRQIVSKVIGDHGGTVARLQGDGVLALFGHSAPAEDDARRATQAALDLHAAVEGMPAFGADGHARLALHSGIHGGLAYLSEGDIERGRIDVLGDVINTASRLGQLARRGEICVSRGTLGRERHFFRYTSRGLCAIRGRSQPVDVLSIEGRATVEFNIGPEAIRNTMSFAGRGAALVQLHDAANEALNGNSCVLVVTGEPGIGKTRLIDQFQRQLDIGSFRILQGYCERYLGAEPLQPFMQVIRTALGWQMGAAPEDNRASIVAALDAIDQEGATELAAAALELLGGVRESMPMSPTRRIAAIVDLLGFLVHRQTLVLVFDDWQWADDMSRNALEALRARRTSLLVLISSREGRDEDSSVPGARVVPLQPLDSRESELAIRGWLPHAEPFVIQDIHRLSGGNPLFIEELCHVAKARGEVRSTLHGAEVAWINSLVASRMARLPAAQVAYLQAASVAGSSFGSWLLQKLIGEDEASPLFAAVAEADFLVHAEQPGTLRFKHVLTRDAVYATVDLAKRRALHRRVAEALESVVGDDQPFEWLEALSYHYDAAGLSEQTANYAEAAGDKALSAMSLDRARTQYITALRSLDAVADLPRATQLRWCAIAQKLGQTCVFDVLDVAETLVLFERAATLARHAHDANALARAEYWLAYVYYGKGQPRRAVAHCESALMHARASEDSRLVAQVQATLGQALASAGRYAEALPLLAQAVESKRLHSRPGSSAAIGSAYTLARTAYTLGDIGRFDEAEPLFAESLRLLGGHVHAVAASIHELICAVHLWQGRWEDAVAEGTLGAEIALGCRSKFNTAMGRALAACGSWAADHNAAALDQLRESTQWIEVRGGAISTSLNYGWLVEAAVTLGDVGEARASATRLFMRARAQDRQGEAMGCRALARLAATHGNAALAHRYLGRADRAAAARGSRREACVNLFTRAQVAALGGQTDDATAMADEAARTFASMDMRWHERTAITFLAGF